MTQTTFQTDESGNYLQLRCKRERTPFFFRVGPKANGKTLVGDVVDERGECLKPNERIDRAQIAKCTRAIMTEGEWPRLIPVTPVPEIAAKQD